MESDIKSQKKNKKRMKNRIERMGQRGGEREIENQTSDELYTCTMHPQVIDSNSLQAMVFLPKAATSRRL